MQEAFRKALDDYSLQPPIDRDSRGLDVLHLTLAADGGAVRIDPTKLAYRLDKMARHWCAYTHPGMDTPGRRAELQDAWVPLAYQLGILERGERIMFLERFSRGILACPISRQRDYLFRAAAGQYGRFDGVAAIPGVAWPSANALFVHCTEELEDCTSAECQELHHGLAYETAPVPREQFHWLLEHLADWLISRRPSLAGDGRAA